MNPPQPSVHVALITHENPDQTLVRWKRDVHPGLQMFTTDWKVTVVDNSARPSDLLHTEFRDGYLWQNGRNLQYGPSLNLAVPRHPTAKYVLYVCTKHGKAFDHSWVRDLLEPLERWPQYGMSGHLMGSNSPEGVAADGGPGCEWVAQAYRWVNPDGFGEVKQHVQGGVFAARTALMLQFPYPAQYPHNYTDHLLTWAILKAGHEVYDVQSVKSVWRECVPNTRGFKYIHSLDHT